MPRVIVTKGAAAGLARCGDFLHRRDPAAAQRAAERISQQFERLETLPEIGRPFPLDPKFRELPIGFGQSGYVALYRYEPDEDAVYVLAFRHQREAGY